MKSRFIVHRHKTGRTHFDLRVLEDEVYRSWSLLQEPPKWSGQRRLAIERESFSADALRRASLDEQAFGPGGVYVWDEGEVEITHVSDKHLLLDFQGARLAGRYRMRRMSWYPGNHWLIEKG